MIENLLLPGVPGPGRLVSGTEQKTADPSELRVGVVTEVTARGITVAISEGSVAAGHLDSYAPAVGDNAALMKTQDSWLALGRVVGSATPTDLNSPGSGIGPSVLDAMISSGGGGTLASSTGALVTVPKFSLDFYHPPGHQVLVLAGFNWYGTVTNDWIIAQLWETTTNTQVGQFVDIQSNNAFGRADWIYGCMINDFGGAKRNVVFKIQRLTGTGTIRSDDSTTNRPFMIAYDMGDSSVFRIV